MSKELLKKSEKNCSISIHFCDMKDEGSALSLDLSPNPKRFLIRINKNLTFAKKIVTLAHELVHVKQFYKNEIYISRLDQFQWKWNKKWYTLEYNSSETKEYWSLPWEIEAFGRQIGLFKIWGEESGYDEEHWYKEYLEHA